MENENALQAQQQRPTSVKQFVEMESVRAKFDKILDKNSGKFLGSLLSLVGNDKLLTQASPSTVMCAAQIAATLDLPINKNLGFAYILPYRNGRAGTYEAQFQIG